MSEKGFIGPRGFGTFISPFVEIIEKKGLELVLQTQSTWLCCSSQGVLC